jgi:hypothetical protein
MTVENRCDASARGIGLVRELRMCQTLGGSQLDDLLVQPGPEFQGDGVLLFKSEHSRQTG